MTLCWADVASTVPLGAHNGPLSFASHRKGTSVGYWNLTLDHIKYRRQLMCIIPEAYCCLVTNKKRVDYGRLVPLGAVLCVGVGLFLIWGVSTEPANDAMTQAVTVQDRTLSVLDEQTVVQRADKSAGDAPVTSISGPDEANEAVRLILESRCVTCHISGGIGSEALTLNTLADASDTAEQIAFVVDLGYMPPWPPSDTGVALRHDWSLTIEEKRLIVDWAASGGGLDIAEDTRLVPSPEVFNPLDVDQRIPPRDGPYGSYRSLRGEPLRLNDYRCQVHEVEDPEGDGTWVTGFDLTLDGPVLHHAVVYLAPPEALSEIAQRIAEEDQREMQNGLVDQPGWTCYGLTGLHTPGVRVVHTWAPGMQPMVYPDGYGVYIPSGAVLVNQNHYHYEGALSSDAPSIVLQTASNEESARLTGMQEHAYATPAEIPCTPSEAQESAERAVVEGDDDLCIRSNALSELVEQFGDIAAALPDILNWQCGGTADDFAMLDGAVGHSSCDLVPMASGTIHSVWPHMHEFGAAYRLTLNPDTPSEVVLLEVPVWNFNLQLLYQPQEDIHITADDMFRFECWWDRTLQVMPTPRYIVWNLGTDDEMCYTSIWTIPDAPPSP